MSQEFTQKLLSSVNAEIQCKTTVISTPPESQPALCPSGDPVLRVLAPPHD